jgi:hypothetical protein
MVSEVLLALEKRLLFRFCHYKKALPEQTPSQTSTERPHRVHA